MSDRIIMSIPVQSADFDEQTITLHIGNKEMFDRFMFYFDMRLDVDITPLLKIESKGKANENDM